ncbi:MAG: NlpC/P60 family protein [Agathobacter sp.]
MKFYLHKANRKRRRVVSALLVACIVASLPIAGGQNTYNLLTGKIEAFATNWTQKKNEAEQQKNQVQQNLNNKKNEISNMQQDQKEVNSNINSTSANLNTIIAEIEETSQKIVNKQAEIDQAAQDLAAAQADADAQYEAMKLRIQFMYEHDTDDSMWEALLGSEGMAEMMTRLEYIADVYASDRALMDAYLLAVQMVEERQAQLAADMEELVDLQNSLEDKKTSLQSALNSLKNQSANIEKELADAAKAVTSYQNQIKKLEDLIREYEAAAAGVNPDEYEGGGTGSGGFGTAKYLQDDSYNPEYRTSIDPNELVNYALQFVGNPYVWGGNSLTNGIDCSGFVKQVYAHFGISTPRYSQSFKTSGQPVSFNNMKAGDVVVYPGHVAIYMGNGKIVEAQSSKTGITNYRSVRCHTITGIRRLL